MREARRNGESQRFPTKVSGRANQRMRPAKAVELDRLQFLGRTAHDRVQRLKNPCEIRSCTGIYQPPVYCCSPSILILFPHESFKMKSVGPWIAIACPACQEQGDNNWLACLAPLKGTFYGLRPLPVPSLSIGACLAIIGACYYRSLQDKSLQWEPPLQMLHLSPHQLSLARIRNSSSPVGLRLPTRETSLLGIRLPYARAFRPMPLVLYQSRRLRRLGMFTCRWNYHC